MMHPTPTATPFPPIHVILNDDFWTIISAIASIAVASLTGALAFQTKRLADKTSTLSEETKSMAKETKRLAEETRETIAVAQTESAYNERHHQESLSPAVLASPRVIFQYGKVALGGPNNASGHEYTFDLKLAILRNVGFGPALNISAEVRIAGTKLSGVSTIGSLGAGDKLTDIGVMMNSWSEDLYSFTPGPIDSTVLLTYENIFGQLRVTSYTIRVKGSNGTKTSQIENEKITDQDFTIRPISR